MGWLAGWRRRVAVTIPSGTVASDLTAFPFYVDLSHFPVGFWSRVASDGRDIRLTLADGETERPFDLVAIDTGAQTGELHGLSDTLSDASDNTFYIYYDNPSAAAYAPGDTYGRNAVWAAYERVYHLQEVLQPTPKTAVDSSGNNSDTNNATGMAAGRTGQVGAGAEFDGAASVVSLGLANGYFANEDTTLFSFWLRFDAAKLGTATQRNGALGANGTSRLYIGHHDDGYVYAGLGDALINERVGAVVWNPSADTWYHMALVRDGATARVYIDGAEATSFVATFTGTSDRRLVIGGLLGSFYQSQIDGFLDEVRVAENFAPSADWIAAEYANQSDPASFYTVGLEEVTPLGVGMEVLVGDPLAKVDVVSGEYEVTLGQGTATFRTRNAVIAEGTPVQFQLAGTSVFGGLVVQSSRSEDGGENPHHTWVVHRCRDNTEWLRLRYVDETFETGTNIGTAIASLVTDYLAADGFTSTGVATGPALSQDVVLEATSVLDAFDQLTRIALDESGSEYYWRVSPAKDVTFELRGQESAGYNITDAAKPIFQIQVEKDRSRYANSARVIGAANGEATYTETYTAGESVSSTTVNVPQRRFKTLRPVKYLKSVEVEGIRYSVGRDGQPGVDLTADFTFVPGERLVIDAQGVVDVGDEVVIEYVAESQIDVTYTDSAKVTARAAIEGGSGKYEALIRNGQIRTTAVATAIAQAYVEVFGQIPTTVRYQTDTQTLLTPGEVQTISLAQYDLTSVSILITSVRAAFRNPGSALPRFTVTGVSGFRQLRWDELMRVLLLPDLQQQAGEGAEDITADRDRFFKEEIIFDDALYFDSGTVTPDGSVGQPRTKHNLYL